MNETQLIKKIKTLKTIKPRRDWVLLSKTRIFREETRVELFPFFRPVYAGLFCLLLVAGMFEFSQDALPGEYLYTLKRISEKGRMVFSSEQEKPSLELDLVNRRLEELNEIVKDNEVKKLAPALKEYQASVSEATKKLVEAMTTTSDPIVIKKIAEKTKKIEENKEKLTKVYGVAGLEGDEELSLVKIVVEWQIEDMESRALSDEDMELFSAAKEDYGNGDYIEALVKILDLSQK